MFDPGQRKTYDYLKHSAPQQSCFGSSPGRDMAANRKLLSGRRRGARAGLGGRAHALIEMLTFGGPTQDLLQWRRTHPEARPPPRTAALFRGQVTDPHAYVSPAARQLERAALRRRQGIKDMAEKIDSIAWVLPRAEDPTFGSVGLKPGEAAAQNIKLAKDASNGGAGLGRRMLMEKGVLLPRRQRERGGRRAREARQPKAIGAQGQYEKPLFAPAPLQTASPASKRNSPNNEAGTPGLAPARKRRARLP